MSVCMYQQLHCKDFWHTALQNSWEVSNRVKVALYKDERSNSIIVAAH